MKIIDEKGRLFGKVNIIDSLVIFFILFVLVSLYFGHKRFSNIVSPPVSTANPLSLEFYATANGMSPEVAKLILVGDKVSENGNALAEILDLGKAEVDVREIKIDQDEVVSVSDPGFLQLPLKIRLNGEIKQDYFFYKGEKLRLGSNIPFNNEKYKIMIRIDSSVGRACKLSPFELDISLAPLNQNQIKLISSGDKFIDDLGGGNILNVGEPVLYTLDSKERRTSSLQQLLSEVVIKARLLGQIKDGYFYYAEQKINVGSKIQLKTGKYKVEGVVKSEPRPLHEQRVILQANFKYLMPEVAALIKAGDEEKDDRGIVIAKVKAIINNKPNTTLVQNGGKLIRANHPEMRDVLLVLEIVCVRDKDKISFKNIPVKVGNNLSLMAKEYDLTGTITSVNWP